MTANEIAGCLVAGAALERSSAVTHSYRDDEAACVQTRLDLVTVEPVGSTPHAANEPGGERFLLGCGKLAVPAQLPLQIPSASKRARRAAKSGAADSCLK